MKNIINGFANLFNLFPNTDYMSMIPKDNCPYKKTRIEEDVEKYIKEAEKEYGLKTSDLTWPQ